jgi:hypothetical protein
VALVAAVVGVVGVASFRDTGSDPIAGARPTATPSPSGIGGQPSGEPNPVAPGPVPSPVTVGISAELPDGFTAATLAVSLNGVQVGILRLTTAEPAGSQPVTARPGRYAYRVTGEATRARGGGRVPVAGSGTVDIDAGRTLVLLTVPAGGDLVALLGQG